MEGKKEVEKKWRRKETKEGKEIQKEGEKKSKIKSWKKGK